MIDQTAHYYSVTCNRTNYDDRGFLPPFFEENYYGIDTGGQEGHYEKIYHELQVSVDVT